MGSQLKTIINEAQALPPLEQIELITAISRSLEDVYKLSQANNNFWQPKTLEQHYKEQRIEAVKNIFDFTGDFWPEDESVDEFNDYIYKQRHEDRLRN
jgi:hypothetical protein